MAELLPCPFCGGEAEILTAESMRGGYLFGIMCNDCCSRGDVYETEAEAIEAWNTRAERVPEIVRCRDCKYLCDDGSTWGCAWHCSCLSTNDGTPPDDFCSWGEQRTDKGAAIDAAEYQAAINPNTDFDR